MATVQVHRFTQGLIIKIEIKRHRYPFFLVASPLLARALRSPVAARYAARRHEQYQIPLPWTGRTAPLTPPPAGVTRKIAASMICSRLTHFSPISSREGFIHATFDWVTITPGPSAFTQISHGLPCLGKLAGSAAIAALAELYANIIRLQLV